MPIRWTISHEQRRVVATAEGIVTLREAEDYLDAIVIAEAGPYAKLFDASNMTAKFTDHDVMMLGARMQAYAKAMPGGPVAFIVVTRIAREYIERFINLAGGGRPITICRNLDEAHRWLERQT